MLICKKDKLDSISVYSIDFTVQSDIEKKVNSARNLIEKIVQNNKSVIKFWYHIIVGAHKQKVYDKETDKKIRVFASNFLNLEMLNLNQSGKEVG